MNVLDWFLVVLVLAYAVSGYWQGFIAGAFATGGLLLGGLLGIWLAPRLLGDAEPALWVSLAALFVVLVCASFGQAILQYAGAKIRSRIKWQPVRALDAVGGAALSMAAVLVVAWALGVAVSGAKLPWASREVRSSAVLDRVNGVMPANAVEALNSFNDVVGSSFFPRYLEPFAPRADHRRRARRRDGWPATPTCSAPRRASSRSAARTPAAAGWRAAASSTAPAG